MNTSSLRLALMVAGAVAITAVATAAITATIGGDDSVLTADEVGNLLGTTPTGTGPTTTGTAGTPTDVATGAGDLVATLVPGTVTVRCEGDLATLVSWSPNPGFRSDDPVRGPAAQVSVRFESDYYDDYLVTASCDNGTATAQLGPDTDDHGGNRGHGGGDD